MYLYIYIYIITLSLLNTTEYYGDSKNDHMFVVESLLTKQEFHASNLTPHLGGTFTKKLVQRCWEDEFFFSSILWERADVFVARQHDKWIH